MKKILVVFMVLILGACTTSTKVENVEVKISESTVFSKMDIEDAIYTLKNHFEENYAGSELLQIQYEETKVLDILKDKIEKDSPLGNTIILFADFKVGANNQNVTLTSNKKYLGHMFVLTRKDVDSTWVVLDSTVAY